MNIPDKIYEYYHGILKHNMKPEAIYLGRTEFIALKKWTNFTRSIPKPRDDKPLEFLGMKIYEVDIENHFNVTGVPE